MAFDIKFMADVSAFIKGTDNVAEALDDISDDLKDVAKVSDKALDSVEKDLEGVTKESQDMDRKVSKAFKNMADEARESGKKTGKSFTDGTDKAKSGLDDLKDESASTAKEAAASFGSIEDGLGALQEVAANAFVGFGPAGMAAGLVAAAGIGLAISSLQDHADKINENKEKMLELAQTIRDNGGVLTEADYIKNMEDYGYAIQDTKEWFEIFQEDAISGFEKIKKIADDTGKSTQDIFKGGFGDLKSSKSELRDVEKQLQALKDKSEALYNMDGSIADPVDTQTKTSLEEYKKLIENNIRAQEQAVDQEKTRKQAIQGTTKAVQEDMAAIEKHTDAIKGSVSAELDAIESQAAVTESFKTNGATLDENTQKGRDNIRAILDSASAIEDQANASLTAGENTDAVTKKFQTQKDTLVAQVMPAFGNSKAKAEAYIDTLLKTPTAVNTNVVVHGIPAAEAKVRNFVNTGRHIQVNFRTGDTYAVDNYIAGMVKGVTVPVNFAARGKPAIG